MTVKKVLILIMSLSLSAGLLSSCAGKNALPDAGTGGLKIVAATFPEYDWMLNILGSNPGAAQLTLLSDKGVDLHSFQPSARDILKISECDIFVHVGGESDKWVEDALEEAVNKNLTDVNLLDILGDAAKEEEMLEGMQEERNGGGEEEEKEFDEHIWLSLKNASFLTGQLSEVLQKADPEHADIYQQNSEAYIQKLNALDESYQKAVDSASGSVLLFGDRFPFRYLADDYGLSCYAAFSGCSAETEASFETITFLAGKADELSLPAVLTIDGGDVRIAETIVQNTRTKDQKILTLDSMQSTSARDIDNGVSYLSIMEKNLAVLKEALGGG